MSNRGAEGWAGPEYFGQVLFLGFYYVRMTSAANGRADLVAGLKPMTSLNETQMKCELPRTEVWYSDIATYCIPEHIGLAWAVLERCL